MLAKPCYFVFQDLDLSPCPCQLLSCLVKLASSDAKLVGHGVSYLDHCEDGKDSVLCCCDESSWRVDVIVWWMRMYLEEQTKM